MTAGIRADARVRILHPSYVARKPSTVISPEFLSENQPGDRWIVQVDAEDILLSLHPNDFLVLN